MDLEYLKLMNRNEMTALPARQELEIGVMVASSDPVEILMNTQMTKEDFIKKCGDFT